MTDDIFGDIETPDEGFDTARPEPHRPKPKPNRPDPHRDGGFGDGGFFDDQRPETPIDEFFEDRSTPEGLNIEAEDAEDVQHAMSPNDYALMYGGEATDQSRESFLPKGGYDEPEGYDPDDLDVETIGEKARERTKMGRIAKVSGAVIVGGALLVGATLWGVNAFTGSGSDDAIASDEDFPQWATEAPEFAEGGQFNAEFSDAAIFSVSTTGPTSWFAAGIAELTDDGELILYSNVDGEELASVEVGDYEYIVEFRHGDSDVIGVRTDDGLTAVRDDGEVETFEFDGHLVVNGESPIVHGGETTEILDFEDGLTEFSVNNSLNTVAADDGIVYQVDPDEPVLVSFDATDTSNADEVDLVPPEDGARFVRWAGAGHGYAAAVWGNGNGLWLGVHDVETGEAETFLSADDATQYWQVGRGLTAATIDDYAISLITGELLVEDDQLEGAYSHYVFTDDRRFFDASEDPPTVYSEGSRVIGASGTTIFVRTPSGDVAAYDRQEAAV